PAGEVFVLGTSPRATRPRSDLPGTARRRRLRAAKPAVSAKRKAAKTPTISRLPKLLIIGVGEISRARKPAAVARQAMAIVGPPALAALLAASAPDSPPS